MIAAVMKFIYRLFQPVPSVCPCCGKEGRGVASAASVMPIRHPEARAALNALCASCRAKVPWILEIACPTCGRSERCGDCPRRAKLYFTSSRSAVRYEGDMKELLAAYKYQGAERLAPIMAAMLASAFERIASMHDRPFDLVTAVPLSDMRLAERGFNQAERMAAILAGWYGLPYANLLVRTRDSDKQSLKGRGARIRDMRGLFRAAARTDSATRKRILLVDDIYTTGSTMNECAHALLQAFPEAEIHGLAWARA
ncbi:ComF family protein [Cohnella hashimotonis]|uniref:ComF family protein n=1 Tax=Cohnella hashimotonis TaxID=2826895 RepID=A0ABT6TU01_9BACL|nr:ComF family protein [Cohnella hashimotonis]MDI4650344.1 ComF family protein [Cohnella hashimotonis]